MIHTPQTLKATEQKRFTLLNLYFFLPGETQRSGGDVLAY